MTAETPPDVAEPSNPPKSRGGWRRWIVPDFAEGNWTQRLRRIVLRIGFWYLVIVLMIGLFQRKLIYFPKTSGRLSAAETRLAKGTVHDITLETHDGLTLHGWHFLPRDVTADDPAACAAHLAVAKWLVLYFHGNAGNRKDREFDCRVFTDNGADVFHFDYRGYGENPGSPTETDFIADAKAVWQLATEDRKVPPSKIVIFGESLGGGVATQLAAIMCEAGTPPAGLILIGTFSSLADTGAWHYPWLPVRWLLRDRYESAEYAPRVTCPVLQLHGSRDDIVPVELGRKLHAAFPEKSKTGVAKTWIEPKNAGHHDISDGTVWRAIKEFLATL